MTRPTYQQYHTDLPLTNISIAYTPGEYISANVFPAVKVEKISGKYYNYDKSSWLRTEMAARAPGAKAVRTAGYPVSSSAYACVEIALATGIPDEDVDNSDAPLRPLEDKTRWLTEQAYLQIEVDVAAVAFGNSVWSGSATPSTLWGNQTSTPLQDVEAAACAIRLTIGRSGLSGVLGYEVWSKLKHHAQVEERIKYGATPGAPAVITLNAVAALMDLDSINVGTAIRNSAADGATDAIAPVWGKHFLVYYKPGSPSLYTPAAGYTFTYRNREIRRFREDQERQDVVEISWHYVVKKTAADAGYLLKSVVS